MPDVFYVVEKIKWIVNELISNFYSKEGKRNNSGRQQLVFRDQLISIFRPCIRTLSLSLLLCVCGWNLKPRLRSFMYLFVFFSSGSVFIWCASQSEHPDEELPKSNSDTVMAPIIMVIKITTIMIINIIILKMSFVFNVITSKASSGILSSIKNSMISLHHKRSFARWN